MIWRKTRSPGLFPFLGLIFVRLRIHDRLLLYGANLERPGQLMVKGSPN